MNVNRRQAAIDALAFQFEAGVDVALDETAPDRFVEQPKTPVAATAPARGFEEAPRAAPPLFTPTPMAPAVPPPVLPGAEAAVTSAREAAKSAATLDALRAELARFDGCALKTTAMNLVFADGNTDAQVMFVGEAPGAEEDREGLPFVGRSGKLLDRMLAAIGLDRRQVYIAYIVPWRPPGNRTPTPQESAICLPFVRRQIELSNAEVLVCLGGPSAQTLLNIRDGITKSRGRWYPFQAGARELRALATFHPAFLLRSPLQKRLAWRDFLALRKALAN